MSHTSQRRGVALLITLAAIALVTALLLATAWRIGQNATVARAETLEQRALAGAEGALWQAVATADPATLRAQPIGGVTLIKNDTTGMATSVWITRVDTALVWVTAEAAVQQGAAKGYRRIGVSAILPDPRPGARLRPTPGRAWVPLF